MRTRARIRLEHLSGPDDGKIVAFAGPTIVLGRYPTQDLVLAHDPTVSGRHARLTCQGDTLYIEDLGSKQGTFVSGRRIEARVELAPGAVFRIGHSWFAAPEQEPR